jgi:hypothetical protein
MSRSLQVFSFATLALLIAANSCIADAARWPWQSSIKQYNGRLQALSEASDEDPKDPKDAFLSAQSRPLPAALALLHSLEADKAAKTAPLGLDATATVFSSKTPLAQRADALADTSQQKFDLGRATMFARMTSTAYCSNVDVIMAWNCTRCLMGVKGFATHSVVFDHAWDLLGYVGYSTVLNGIVVAFRGTDSNSWGNW